MASASIKFGQIAINPNYLFFNRGGVFAMVVHNPIAKGRKHIIFMISNKKYRYIGMPA